jgi:hypothetical protein
MSENAEGGTRLASFFAGSFFEGAGQNSDHRSGRFWKKQHFG